MNHNNATANNNSSERRRGSVHVVDRIRLEQLMKQGGPETGRTEKNKDGGSKDILKSPNMDRNGKIEEFSPDIRNAFLGEKKRLNGTRDIEIVLSEHQQLEYEMYFYILVFENN